MSAGDGVYWLDPDGAGGQAPFEAYCDMTTQGGGWTLVMKAAGTEFSYYSTHWTQATTYNPTSLDLSNTPAKYQSFNSLDADELLLDAESGNFTQFTLPQTMTALELFQGSPRVLTPTAGSATPSELINNKTWTYCGAPWRVNTKGSHNAQIRLGGWVTQVWNCGYGTDGAGQPTGAHLLGLGIDDSTWSPFVYHVKSFGIRDAHDLNYLDPGQLTSFALVYVR